MKVLLLDIETAPNLVHVWGLYEQNVAINQIQASGYVLCWAAKWYGDKDVMFDSVHHSKPKRMVSRIHKLLDEADVAVHYNGTKFDIPTLNKEFVLHGLTPPAPYKQVDLLRTARGQFRFPSNKLDYISQALGLGKKHEHKGHELWVQCMAGNVEAWKTMEAYNRQDVVLLEKVYDRLRPWIRSHPNHSTHDEPGIPVCPSCGHHHLQRRGVARTVANIYARYQCMNCGGWSREPFTELQKEDRGIIMRQI
jgi:DNA polymerase elongation subunit (family B)